MTLAEFESSYRKNATFYTAGFVADGMSASGTELSLAHPLSPVGGENRTQNHCALRDWLLVASDLRSKNISTLISNNDVSFVTYIQVDDEIMKIVAISGAKSRGPGDPPFDVDPPQPATIRVIRGFAGSVAAPHSTGARVLSPVSLDTGVTNSNTRLQWAVTMSGALGADLLVNYTLADVAAGYTGSWYDNFGGSLFNAKTTTGCGLRTHEMFDPETKQHWSRPRYFAAQQRRFAAARTRIMATLGRKSPVPAVGNGFAEVQYPSGSCDVDGPCTTLSDLQAGFKAGFVDGWILEGFYGNEVFPTSTNTCGSNGKIVLHDQDKWQMNVQSVAWAIQAGIPVYPIIFQAGCKSPTLEYQPDSVRGVLEEGAYASFLLAVEPLSQEIESAPVPFAFGINAMWRTDSEPTVPYARLHPQYTYPLGSPTDSYPPDQFGRYQITSAPNGVYGRVFTNGLVLYNSANATTSPITLPQGPWIDPVTNASLHSYSLGGRMGKIFLRHW